MVKVVITGMGAVTPLGNSLQKSWNAVKKGKSGIRHLTKLNATDMPWKVAGELSDFDATQFLSRKEVNSLDQFIHYAVAAAVMAAEDAGLLRDPHSKIEIPDTKNISITTASPRDYMASGGVIIGSSRGGISTLEKALMRMREENSRAPRPKPKIHNRRLSPYLMPATTVSMASSSVAQKLGIKGSSLGVSNACASGTNAIGEAFRCIRTGFRGPIFAGGTEAPLCRLCIEGYGVAGALTKKTGSNASRPFDRWRDGFVLSEGACVLVLEDYDCARKRGATIYGEVTGYGNTTDAYHITRPDAEGEAKAIRAALEEAGIHARELDYINTHGTATLLGDRTEAESVRKVFGKRRTRNIPVTATKSVTGHMLAASGAFEVAVTLLSLKEGIIPPSINLEEKDSECDLNIITQEIKADMRTAISNSFGFGGVNAVLSLRRL